MSLMNVTKSKSNNDLFFFFFFAASTSLGAAQASIDATKDHITVIKCLVN